MQLLNPAVTALAVTLAAVCGGCSTDGETGEHGSLAASRGEHDRDGGEHGEESGAQYARTETHDAVRNGVRLVLAYDSARNSFVGTVQNTTEQTLERVRVEVHLSNGRELGPTQPIDLGPGAAREVVLAATTEPFDSWSTHPEVGSGEHGHETGGEHRERRGEHR